MKSSHSGHKKLENSFSFLFFFSPYRKACFELLKQAKNCEENFEHKKKQNSREKLKKKMNPFFSRNILLSIILLLGLVLNGSIGWAYKKPPLNGGIFGKRSELPTQSSSSSSTSVLNQAVPLNYQHQGRCNNQSDLCFFFHLDQKYEYSDQLDLFLLFFFILSLLDFDDLISSTANNVNRSPIGTGSGTINPNLFSNDFGGSRSFSSVYETISDLIPLCHSINSYRRQQIAQMVWFFFLIYWAEIFPKMFVQ